MNSRRNFAGGAVLSIDYSLPYLFALGLNITVSHNFFDTVVLESTALVRRYFATTDHTGFFAQADLGFHAIFENGTYTIDGETVLRSGYRLLLREPFYLEPFGRLGYPFAFGIGLIGGIRF